MARSSFLSGIVLFLTLSAVGCSTKPKKADLALGEKYDAPALEGGNVRVKSAAGIFIERIDGQAVSELKIEKGASVQGNQTVVLPGPHKVGLFVEEKKGNYRTDITFNFERGHEYEFSKAMDFKERTVKLRDKNTGRDYFITASTKK